jgi:disulfide bond formation protein DsbB
LAVALLATAGSLYLSMGMGLKACPLCFYQRTFVMGVVGVLVLGLVTGSERAAPLSLLALPLAVGGLGVAGFHVYLEEAGKLECPRGVFGLATAPKQSLAALALLTAVLLVDALSGWRAWGGIVPLGLAAGAVLSLGFAFLCVRSAPPPQLPTKEYDSKEIDTCRPPFRPQ